MPENEQKDNNARKQVNNYIKYTGIGFQMVVIIGVMTFIGYKIDQNANHEIQWVTAVMSLAGVFISLYIVIKSVKE